MGIATLIAAGRLDDRLIDRALGLLRELDPAASFPSLDRRGRCRRPALRWKGAGSALGARRARRRRRRRPAGGTAVEAAARLGHGFRPSSARNASTSSPIRRPEGEGRAHHRARDAGGAGFPIRPSREGPAARRPRRAGAETMPRRAGRDHCRGGDARPDHEGRGRELPAGVRRLSLLRQPDRRGRGVRPRQGQPPRLRRRQAQRRSRRSGGRCDGQARGAGRGARATRARATPISSPWAMGPTTG